MRLIIGPILVYGGFCTWFEDGHPILGILLLIFAVALTLSAVFDPGAWVNAICMVLGSGLVVLGTALIDNVSEMAGGIIGLLGILTVCGTIYHAITGGIPSYAGPRILTEEERHNREMERLAEEQIRELKEQNARDQYFENEYNYKKWFK